MKKILSLFALAVCATALMADDEPATENYCLKATAGGGSYAWDYQVAYVPEVACVTDGAYTLSMKLKATENCNVAFWPCDDDNEKRNQWGGTDAVQYCEGKNVTTEWATYTWKFTAIYDLDKLSFVFGTLNGALFIDDVVLKKDDVGVNMITNGDFAEPKTDGWQPVNNQISIATVEGGDLPTPGEPEIPDTYELVEQGNPKVHVFLAFGQSNMEGNAAVEAQDKQDIPGNFLTVRAVDYNGSLGKKGDIVEAMPPLCRQGTGLTPCDYFGRFLAQELGSEDTIIVINVAVGGARIELFMEEYKDEYIAGEAQWFQNYCAQYNNDPLGRLVEMGKIAQQRGVIEGILLHQGCSNCGQADWAEKVAKIHKRLCYYLGISRENTPLLAGELLYANMGGGCSYHNTAALPKLPKLMENAYIISAKDCPGNGVDAWHFSAEGYRMIGKRYGEKMYELMTGQTGIEEIKCVDTVEGCFDLCGRKAILNKAGIYVNNGKGIIVK